MSTVSPPIRCDYETATCDCDKLEEKSALYVFSFISHQISYETFQKIFLGTHAIPGLHCKIIFQANCKQSSYFLKHNIPQYGHHASKEIYIYSPCIYLFVVLQCALDQLFAFCANKVLETKVAGKMASDMCRAAARVSLQKYQLLG